jgi:hypothetical protein
MFLKLSVAALAVTFATATAATACPGNKVSTLDGVKMAQTASPGSQSHPGPERPLNPNQRGTTGSSSGGNSGSGSAGGTGAGGAGAGGAGAGGAGAGGSGAGGGSGGSGGGGSGGGGGGGSGGSQ